MIVVALFLLATGCGGGGGGGVTPPTLVPSFSTGTVAGPDIVRLRGGSVAGDTITVEVAIGGPTTGDDLYAFAFDLLLSDTTIVRFVDGSEVAGNVLVAGAGQSIDVQAKTQGDRVVVGITKLGGGAGNRVTAAEAVIVRLAFRGIAPGSSTIAIAPAGNGFPAPEALDSKGVRDPNVTFDLAPATITVR